MHTTPDQADASGEQPSFAPYPPLPPHHVPRVVVNCLAGMVGLVGLLWILGVPWFWFSVAYGRYSPHVINTNGMVMTGILTASCILAVLGCFMLRQAWIHWRRPDQHTANRVSGMASLVMWLYLLQLAVGRNSIIPNRGLAVQFACALGLALGCYLIYRFVLKRVAARTYPGWGLAD